MYDAYLLELQEICNSLLKKWQWEMNHGICRDAFLSGKQGDVLIDVLAGGYFCREIHCFCSG